MIHRQKIPLDRDIVFLAEAGEESTPQVGIGFLVARHWDRLDSEFALAEGGTTALIDGRIRYVGVATTEKVPRRMRLIAHGISGHGSIPRPDNPVIHLAAAIAKLGAWQPPSRLNETTRTFFQKMAEIGSPEQALMYSHLEDPQVGGMIQEKLRFTNMLHNSMLRTSIAPTIIKGGFRTNVIPAEAEATLDVRALPDEDMDRLVADLKRLIDDPAVEIVREAVDRPATAPSRLDSEMFQVLERTQRVVFPGAVTVPLMLTGATDMAYVCGKSVQAYGISGPTAEEAFGGAHGNDERIGVDALGKYVEFIYRAVVAVAGAS